MNALGPISRRTFCALAVTALATAHTAHAADTPEPGLPVAPPEAVGVDSAPLIRLSYGGMVWMALPYTVTMTGTALLAVTFLL